MVKGLDTFCRYFSDYTDQYILIGGAACDILFESNDVEFRATDPFDEYLLKKYGLRNSDIVALLQDVFE